VLLDLRALMAMSGVLDGEFVESELALHQASFSSVGSLRATHTNLSAAIE
jgi:hypothetical protein